MKLTKPIESATVFFKGDPSVGIHSCSFDLALYFDPKCYGGDKETLEALSEIRIGIADLYELIGGDERPFVMFDFEIIAERELEERLYAKEIEDDLKIEQYIKENPRPSQVRCPTCDGQFDSDKVGFVDIESDIQERDVMTFICPNCKTEKQSLVFL